MRAGIITVSDRCSRGEREDRTGPAIAELLENEGIEVGSRTVVPDEREGIRGAVRRMVGAEALDLVVLAGGTGIGPRDVTPEAVEELVEKSIPGFGEAMRMKSLEATPRAVLSRSGAGTMGGSLLIYTPGSPRAATECLGHVIGAVAHAVEVLKGAVPDCGGPLDSPPEHG